jgi:hypothetical protein
MQEKATLAELNSVYNLEDLYDLIEIIEVEGHNERVMNEWRKARER